MFFFLFIDLSLLQNTEYQLKKQKEKEIWKHIR